MSLQPVSSGPSDAELLDRQQRQLSDYTEEVNKLLPGIIQPIDNGNNPSALPSVLSALLAFEKKTRLAADAKSTVTIAKAILNACWQCKAYASFNEHVSLLSKRRAQLQKVVECVVQLGTELVAQLDHDEDKQREMIETLRTVSAGKMFVELERAQLTRRLCALEERHGRVREAAELLQEVQVETIGSMDAHEKAHFLLEQIRLVLAKKDYVRTEIIAKKVDIKLLKQENFQDVKIKFYQLMIEYHKHFSNYFEICKCYVELFHTKSIASNDAQSAEALSNIILYGILSPWSNEVSDLLHRIESEKKLESLSEYKQLLLDYVGSEVIAWPLLHSNVFEANAVFKRTNTDATPYDIAKPEAERKEGETSGAQRWSDLHKRIVQHNIRVIGGYYSRITASRLSELINLDEQRTESLLCELVSTGGLWARIDRPSGLITFSKPKLHTQILNDYAADLTQLLNVVEKTCHMINKENMIHKIK